MSGKVSYEDKARAVDALYWAESIGLVFGGMAYSIKGHDYQVDDIRSVHSNEVNKYSVQMGKTIGQIIKRMHGLIYGVYPQGVMYVFPTAHAVNRFSQARFTPLIEDNPEIRRFVAGTDNIELKRVGRANLYFAGGKPQQKVAGIKKESVILSSEPVDCVVEDEHDLIDPAMSDLAMHRMDHSELKHRARIGKPTIPDYGIDRAYAESDQKVWVIKCRHCGGETCLELEFPECITEEGKRLCKKCRREIFPCNGDWVSQYPDREKDCSGRWISQLNSTLINPATILKAYRNPPNGNIAEVYNSMLGMAYISAENQLSPNDLWAILGRDLMLPNHPGPTAMGVDVGSGLHVVILDKPNDYSVRLVKAVNLSGKNDFNDLHDLAKAFNVKSCVFDFAPEQRKVREFREQESFEVYGCIYQEKMQLNTTWDSKDGLVRVNRTEICDATHDLVIKPGKLILPRKSDAVDEFIKHMCNLVKVLHEDEDTGSKEYKYRKRGPDHYRHALNYALLASQRVGIYVPKEVQKRISDGWDVKESHGAGGWLGA